MSSNKGDSRHRGIKERTKKNFIPMDTGAQNAMEADRAMPKTTKKNKSKSKTSSASEKREMVYQITMKNDGNAPTALILQTLYEIEGRILPFNIIEVEKRNFIRFTVCTFEEADVMRLMNRRLAHPTNPNDRYLIYCDQIPATWDTLTLKFKGTIREVVQSRDNAASNSVDLRDFQNDKLFDDRDLRLFSSLARPVVMVEAIRVVAELFPQITGLSLANNRLNSLKCVESFTFACKNVAELDLTENVVRDVDELHYIRQWKIEHLSLLNNPLTSGYDSSALYISAVQTHLPHVTYLDGVIIVPDREKIARELKRRAGTLMPSSKPFYVPDEGLKQRVEQLLVQFYELYDGNPSETSRQLLASAYDENATFTCAVGPLVKQLKKADRCSGMLRRYSRITHNIHEEKKPEQVHDQVIFKGPLTIVVALSQLPQTEHDKGLFSLEFNTVRQQFLIFTVRGIYRDSVDLKYQSVNKPETTVQRFFTRTFVVVPRDRDKLAIINDSLTVSAISKEFLEDYTAQLKKASGMSIEPENASLFFNEFNGGQALAAGGIQQQPDYNKGDPVVQQAMVESFSQQSGMKLEWSRKCLEDSQWDFETAGNVFNAMKEQIPREAFI